MTLANGLLLAGLFLFLCLWLTSRSRAKDLSHQRNVLEAQRDRLESQVDATLANNTRLIGDNERLRKLLSPLPVNPVEEVPGLQRTMQQAVDEAKLDAPQELHRLHEGDRKFPHVGHADVVVEDGRPDARMAKQAEIDEVARINQGTAAKRAPVDGPTRLYGPDSVELTSKARRAQIEAEIRKDAQAEAIALIPPEKLAELKAEGGDEAVAAYVAPVVDELMKRIDEQTAQNVETMLAAPGNIRQTWELGEPQRAPAKDEDVMATNRRLVHGLLGVPPRDDFANPQPAPTPDQPSTSEAETPTEAVVST